MPVSEKRKFDVVFIGAGLSNGLAAWFLKKRRPDLRVLVLESKSEIPRAKTWSFHDTDLSPELFSTIQPLISRSWDGHEVRFPKFQRKFDIGAYHSIRPGDFERKLKDELGDGLQLNTKVVSFTDESVTLENGEEIKASCVIDGRGLNAYAGEKIAYQKFFGMHVELTTLHGLSDPILMDATVEQVDGYRFIYVLPWSPTELLIEDTYYSTHPEVDFERSEFAIREYASLRGWKIHSVLGQESGSLPLPLHLLPHARRSTGETPVIGISGGYFHPVTGYSLPDAVRVADRISRLKTITSRTVCEDLARYDEGRSADWKFLCLLNRLMFEAAIPKERYRVLQHFYQLKDSLVENFYRGSLSAVERVRILSGKPPVPMGAALRCLWSSGL